MEEVRTTYKGYKIHGIKGLGYNATKDGEHYLYADSMKKIKTKITMFINDTRDKEYLRTIVY